VVVFYSDGVTEARNATGEFFGIDRLLYVRDGQGENSIYLVKKRST
jgi:hypothetical protein